MARSIFDLVGMPYRLGGDGSDGTIDCIHLVVTVLDHLRIEHPEITAAMYEGTDRQIARWLLSWGKRVAEPSYDGDVVLFSGQQKAFGVVWNGGILNIGNPHQVVQWTPVWNYAASPCFRTKGN